MFHTGGYTEVVVSFAASEMGGSELGHMTLVVALESMNMGSRT